MASPLYIIKASGERDIYNRSKLIRSLLRSGAKESVANQIAIDVESELVEGISTRKIYRNAFNLLRRKSVQAASQYKLKQAVMQLGPSGYPFEQFVGRIFASGGYDVRVGQLMDGKCVKHEIDVLAVNNNKIMIAECKFRNQPGSKTDVKVPLYFHSRFNDVVSGIKNGSLDFYRPKDQTHSFDIKNGNLTYEGWIVTNAKFTGDAITYGNCSGLKLMGWDYPNEGSLIDRINKSGLLPLTILSSLSSSDKANIMAEGVVICKDLAQNPEVMEKLGIDKNRIKRVRNELINILG